MTKSMYGWQVMRGPGGDCIGGGDVLNNFNTQKWGLIAAPTPPLGEQIKTDS
jgi:hypothetical protein